MKLFTWRSLLPYSSWRSRLIQTSVVFSVSIFVSGASGVQWGWRYVQEQLAPRISRELSQSFNRPIHIGDVESVSLNSIRFGTSSMPATETDQDTITIEAIEVQFSPVEFVRHQQLKIDITLHNPVVWIDEQPEGWLEIDLLASQDEDVEIQDIRIKNASIRLAPQIQAANVENIGSPAKSELYFEAVNGRVTFHESAQRVTFELEGQTEESGHFIIEGISSPDDENVALQIHSNEVAIAPFAPLLPSAIAIQAGTISSNLRVSIGPGNEWIGEGALEVQNVDARTAGEPNPFRDLSVKMELRDRQLHLQQGEVLFGGIPFQNVEGVIDPKQGLDLTAEVAFVSADAFMQTFQLDLPFSVEGALASQALSISGPFDEVVFSGHVYNAQPLVFDRVVIPTATTDFSFNKTTDHLVLNNLQFLPDVGGQLSLNADIHLGDEDEGENDTFIVDAQLADISADRVFQVYDFSLPKAQLGQVYATAHLEVSDEQPKLQMEWAVEQGNYPAQGKIVTEEDGLRLVDTHVQVAGRQVEVDGAIANGQWQAQLHGADITLQSVGMDIPGTVEGTMDLKGQVTEFDPTTVQGQGQAQLVLEKGEVDASFRLSDGRWQALLKLSQIPLHLLDASLPGAIEGAITMSGALNQFSPEAIIAEGEIQLIDALTLQGEPLTASLHWSGDRLEISNTGNSSVNLNGAIAVDFHGWTPTPGEIDLDLSARNLNLEEIRIVPLAELDLHGLLTASGNVSGTIEQPELTAELDLQELSIQHIAFDPQLQGQLRYADNKIDLELQGDRDSIRVQSVPSDGSTRFALKRDRTTIDGSLLANGLLNAQIDALPLSAFNAWANRSLLPSVQGNLSATVVAELKGESPRAQANFEIQQPAIASFQPTQYPNHLNDHLVGTLLYADNAVQLSNGQLHFGNSTVALNGQANLTPSPSGRLHVAINQGNLNDFATVLPGLTPGDAETASTGPLNLPSLNEVQGQFSGEMWVARSPQGELMAQANFNGENWTWGDYTVQTVQIPPTLIESQSEVMLPIYLSGLTYAGATSDPINTQITLSGQWNENAPLGQIQLDPIPLSFIAGLVDLPVTVTGKVGAVAHLSGFPAQPEVVGEVELLNAQVHDVTIPHAKIGFSYGAAGFMLENWESLQTATTAQE